MVLLAGYPPPTPTPIPTTNPSSVPFFAKKHFTDLVPAVTGEYM
jgi:hypothetical protein